MKLFFILVSFVVLTQSASGQAYHLTAPDASLTPGALCNTPSEYRYVAKIPYCIRDVSGSTKREIMKKYMKKFPNLKINEENRLQYKIDHYIPLCMGGSNEIANLWPQHESAYLATDEIEFNLCSDLADGIITQREAVAKIKYAKNNLNQLRLATDPMQFIEFNYQKP